MKAAIAKLKGRETDRRKNWVEKTSTDLARRFDVIAVEDLKIRNMTRSASGTLEAPGRNVRQKAGLNRGILANGWGRPWRGWSIRLPAASRRSTPRVRASGARRAGSWTGRRVRAKRATGAGPADTLATPM